MTSDTDDRLQSHLRILANTATRSADEVEQDVLRRVSRRRRRRHQGTALLGVAVIALVGVMVATAVSAVHGEDDAPKVKTVKEPPDGEQGDDDSTGPPTKLNMVEIQRFEHNGADRTVIEFDAPLPITDLEPVRDIKEADTSEPAWGIQYSSNWWTCDYQHWDATEPPSGMITLHFPARWFEDPEHALEKPVVYPDLQGDGDSPGMIWRKLTVCPYEDSVQVAIWGVPLDGTEDTLRHLQLVSVSVEDGSRRVVVDGRQEPLPPRPTELSRFHSAGLGEWRLLPSRRSEGMNVPL